MPDKGPGSKGGAKKPKGGKAAAASKNGKKESEPPPVRVILGVGTTKDPLLVQKFTDPSQAQDDIRLEGFLV
jgi:hypothetical protein